MPTVYLVEQYRLVIPTQAPAHAFRRFWPKTLGSARASHFAIRALCCIATLDPTAVLAQASVAYAVSATSSLVTPQRVFPVSDVNGCITRLVPLAYPHCGWSANVGRQKSVKIGIRTTAIAPWSCKLVGTTLIATGIKKEAQIGSGSMRERCTSGYPIRSSSNRLAVLLSCVLLVACESSSPRPSVSPGSKSVAQSSAAPAAVASCATPGRCGQPLACEGRQISVAGRIEAVNIFDKTSHPNLPFQKFLLRPDARGEAIEVWVESASESAATEIFKRVRAAAAAQTDVVVSGTAVGVDLPMTGQCNRMIKLSISVASAMGGAKK